MRIDVIADTVCPWCYIGKRRLERALARHDITDIELRWRPFQLNPGIAAGGRDRRSYLEEKFGGAERVSRMYGDIARTGAAERIDFRFDRIARTPNTVNAHRVILYAGRQGNQGAMVEALFRAYFSEGQDIGQIAVLADIAASVGIPRADALGYILSGDDTPSVLEEDLRARNLGVTGVPCFIIERKYAISGAQSPEVLTQVFELAKMDRLQAAR